MATKAKGFDLTIENDDGTEGIVAEADIRNDGWIREDEQDPCERDHCDDPNQCECNPAEPYLDTLTRWHNEFHTGVIRFCDERPCSDLRSVDG